jgi:chromosome segregation protein
LERQAAQRRSRLEAILAERSKLEAEVAQSGQALRAIEGRLAEVRSGNEPAEKAIAESEQQRTELEAAESRARSEMQEAEQGHSQAQIELARRQEEMNSLRRRIEDDFGLVAFDFDETTTGQSPLPLEGLVERLPVVESLPLEVETQVERLRAQLRRMGAVNPEAQREYLEVKERVEFLTTQVDDLRRAESQLQEVIAELDLLMEREFRKTFDAVAGEFRNTFTSLFGGGSARLRLTDPEDMTLTGIDIEARLPGRREQGLSMLSGGERSLTACALIFALLRVSPTPFCVLDEVDAMLDEANVQRFRLMLKDLSQHTQFLVITHNREMASSCADRIITMEKGKIISDMPAGVS